MLCESNMHCILEAILYLDADVYAYIEPSTFASDASASDSNVRKWIQNKHFSKWKLLWSTCVSSVHRVQQMANWTLWRCVSFFSARYSLVFIAKNNTQTYWSKCARHNTGMEIAKRWCRILAPMYSELMFYLRDNLDGYWQISGILAPLKTSSKFTDRRH